MDEVAHNQAQAHFKHHAPPHRRGMPGIAPPALPSASASALPIVASMRPPALPVSRSTTPPRDRRASGIAPPPLKNFNSVAAMAGYGGPSAAPAAAPAAPLLADAKGRAIVVINHRATQYPKGQQRPAHPPRPRARALAGWHGEARHRRAGANNSYFQ